MKTYQELITIGMFFLGAAIAFWLGDILTLAGEFLGAGSGFLWAEWWVWWSEL